MSYRGGYGGDGGSATTMLVESFNAGKIIGRRGCKIKELEQDSNAKIKVAKEEDENGMKAVEITGAPGDVEAARQMIEDCIASNDFGGGGGDGGRRSYGGGYGGGRGGGGRSGGFGRRDDDRGYGRRDRDRDSGDGYGRRDMQDFGGGYERRGFGRGGGRRDEGGESETIYVESSEVGRIIGRGGSKVKELEDRSGCRIKVAKEGDSYGRSPVELIGSKSSISEAKGLITDAGIEIMNGDDSSAHGW